MNQFGDFQTICSHVPSYTWCNLFHNQLSKIDRSALQSPSNTSIAPVGVNPVCGIPRVHNGSLGNIANILACGLSCFVVLSLIHLTGRRKAAVGRVELRIFFCVYFLTLPFQLITTGSFLAQDSSALVVLTAIHAGLVATLFWTLLANAIVATQIVEDGTLSSLVPFAIFSVAFFTATTYISLDVGFSLTSAIGKSNPPQSLNSIPLFVLTSIWPAVAALVYFGIMLYIVLGVLNEIRPVWYYVIAAILFILSQLDYFLLSKIICQGSSMKVDGSFIATILETASVVALYFAWRGITEDDWDNDLYYPS